ncbi:MAG: Fic family protein [Oscillospiraceae bacterium]|jgi:Fic family protein|nr:Fic family protein [Oscillospiraceae bacterium]
MTIYERLDANKAAIDRIRPFEGEYLRQLREYYRIGLTWTSNAIEGNSLTEMETKILLEDGLTVGGKPLRDTLEAVGHSFAYDYMFTLLGERFITVKDIQTLHHLFFKSIDDAHAGVWRDINIIVTGTDYEFPSPDELEGLMAELGRWIETERDSMHPVRFAAMLHLKFVTIHPYIDGNGRVARLLMNTALIQDGYMLAIVPPVLRQEYMTGIRDYQRKGTAEPFCDFITERVLESEKEIMRLLKIPPPKV